MLLLVVRLLHVAASAMSAASAACDRCDASMLDVLDTGLVISGYRVNVDGVDVDLCGACYGALMADRVDAP